MTKLNKVDMRCKISFCLVSQCIYYAGSGMTAASLYICKDFPTRSIRANVGTSAQMSMALSDGWQTLHEP